MKCDYCKKVSDELPYKCKFCGGIFCSDHRLPENHDCIGLERYKDVKHVEFKKDVVKAAKEYETKAKVYAGRKLELRQLLLYAVILIIVLFLVYYIWNFLL
jgi:hypothetical protein